MIQFIQTVLNFIDTVYSGFTDILSFVPKAFSYLHYIIGLLPSFVIPVCGVVVSILIFNRVTKVL